MAMPNGAYATTEPFRNLIGDGHAHPEIFIIHTDKEPVMEWQHKEIRETVISLWEAGLEPISAYASGPFAHVKYVVDLPTGSLTLSLKYDPKIAKEGY
jgi:hypothetical protein